MDQELGCSPWYRLLVVQKDAEQAGVGIGNAASPPVNISCPRKPASALSNELVEDAEERVDLPERVPGVRDLLGHLFELVALGIESADVAAYQAQYFLLQCGVEIVVLLWS